MLLLDSVSCEHGFASYFPCGSGEIWAKLLLNKVKNLSAIPFLHYF